MQRMLVLIAPTPQGMRVVLTYSEPPTYVPRLGDRSEGFFDLSVNHAGSERRDERA